MRANKTMASADRNIPQVLLDLGFDPKTSERLFDLFKETLEVTFKSIMVKSPISAATPSKSQGTELRENDNLKAADLRIALLMGKIPEDAGLLIDAKTFAQLLSISSRTLSRLLDLKAVPKPVHLGRLIRGPVADVLEWIEADCPSQENWGNRKQNTTARKK